MTNTWNAPEGEFATRITLDDLPGYFSKQLTVAQGTRALIIDSGTNLGEVPPGTYTLQSFIDKLKFWKSQKRIDVILVRQDDMSLRFRVESIATVEELLVAVKLSLTVQIEDTALFTRNLLGNRSKLSVEEIRQAVSPVIAQALRETIRQLSIEKLCSPDVRPLLSTGIGQGAKSSLARYGIACADVQTVEIVCEQYDEQRKKTGEVFLLEQNVTQNRKLHEVLDKETLHKIERREREVELGILASHVELDKDESDIALTLRRVGIRKDMRDAVLSDRFDKVRTDDEWNAFVQEHNKEKLLRDDEMDEITSLFKAKKEDREATRKFLVRKLEFERNNELDQVAATIAHAQKIRTFKHEIELANLVDDENTRLWRESLQREIEQSDHDFAEAMKKTQRQHELHAKNLKYARDEDWEQKLHKQKAERLEGEIAEANAAQAIRITKLGIDKERIEEEFKLERKRIEDEYEDERKRKEREERGKEKEQEMTLKEKEDATRLETLKELQRMKKDRETHEADILSQASAQDHKQHIETLNTKAGMSTDALIAISPEENAEKLTQLEKTRAETKAREAEAKAREAVTQSEREQKIRDDAAQRERELQDQRVQDAQKNLTATLETIKEITGQGFGAMGQVAGRPAPAPGYSDSIDPATHHVIICTGCRTKNPPTARNCSSCGKEL